MKLLWYNIKNYFKRRSKLKKMKAKDPFIYEYYK
jgi:hypothetical protein